MLVSFISNAVGLTPEQHLTPYFLPNTMHKTQPWIRKVLACTTMKLIEMWNADIDRAYELVQQFPANENGFENPQWNITRDEFPEFLRTLQSQSQGLGLTEGRVPCTQYVLADDQNHYVGIVKLRHKLTPTLRDGAGHIGYGIAKPYRSRGYATEGLKLCLERAKSIVKEPYIFMSVSKTNPSSLQVQINNGAFIDHEDDKEYYTRIAL